MRRLVLLAVAGLLVLVGCSSTSSETCQTLMTDRADISLMASVREETSLTSLEGRLEIAKEASGTMQEAGAPVAGLNGAINNFQLVLDEASGKGNEAGEHAQQLSDAGAEILTQYDLQFAGLGCAMGT
ncbi:MAG: hypothetical protein KDC39_06125 [Actinobacteria bacterium]|nr:hypothetical protein [Actinomycetota bacterium]